MNPLVSIIIPSYNSSDYLGRCLDSIFNQTYKNIETILVDDGSSEDEYQKTEMFAKKYKTVRLFRQKNSGQGVARNLALAKAQGEWVLFLDSDDSMGTTFVENLVKSIKPNTEIVCCNYTIILRGKKIPIRLFDDCDSFSSKKTIFNLYLNRKIAPAPWCKLIRRDVIGELRFPPFRAREDEYFNLLLFSTVNNIVCSNESEYFRYIRSESTERSKMSFKKMATLSSCSLAISLGKTHFPELSNKINAYCLFNYYALLKEHYFEKSTLNKKTILYLKNCFATFYPYVKYCEKKDAIEITKYKHHSHLIQIKWLMIRHLKTIKRKIIKD